ncbi:MAG TPA: hypothetical protein VFA20_16080 [Myxococcaceae bacterium]|nr:hypothetical protein [Myxococcaceae bacterium]
MSRKRIGELLLEREAITPEQLEEGLAHHRKTRQRLGVALIQLGFLTESELAQVLSQALNIPAIDLEVIQPEWGAIHMLRSRFCESHDLFPYAMEGGKAGRKQLLVAMSDPMNVPALEEIEFSTGLKVSPRIATLSAVRRAIMRWYHKVNPDSAQLDAQTMSVIQKGEVVLQVPGGDDEVVQGEPLGAEDPVPTDRTALADMIKERESKAKASGKATRASLAADLDFLFGEQDDANPVEALERKFWALMRLMAKKGLISKDEFSAELDEDSE